VTTVVNANISKSDREKHDIAYTVRLCNNTTVMTGTTRSGWTKRRAYVDEVGEETTISEIRALRVRPAGAFLLKSA